MNKKTGLVFFVFFLILLSTTQGVISGKNRIGTIFEDMKETHNRSMDNFIDFNETKPISNLIPVYIVGNGDIYTPLFYMALLPMIFIQFIYFVFILLGFDFEFSILEDILEHRLPLLIRKISEVRATWFPFFLYCPYLYVFAGRYYIGDDEGSSFDGSLSGFFGIAHEYSDGRVLVKGFAKKVRY